MLPSYYRSFHHLHLVVRFVSLGFVPCMTSFILHVTFGSFYLCDCFSPNCSSPDVVQFLLPWVVPNMASYRIRVYLCICSSLNCFMIHSALHHGFLYHLWAFLCSPLVSCPWWIPSLLSPFDIHWGSISVPVGFAHVTLIRLWISPNVVAHLLTELVLHQLSFMVQFRSHWALPIVLSLFLLNA